MPEDRSAATAALQARFDTERLAARVKQLTHDALDDGDKAFLARADMFFLATVDPRGQPTCSYRGGDPGFVRPLDDRTVAFPSYDGNGAYLSMGNAIETRRVGMLFVDFENPGRMRIHGDATIDFADPLGKDWPEAQFVVRVRIREIFPNCGRYIHRYQLVERARHVPRAGETTPVAGWKRMDWAKDALPSGDPASDPKRK
jgi:predicted pyridoxine 5'-phosphate oxidase superfamily flavin-nucleotide-binding protein